MGVPKKKSFNLYQIYIKLPQKWQSGSEPPPILFFFCISITIQGVAQGNKPGSQAGLMFNEDDFHRLLITVMSPHTDTFNTARHSRRPTQCQGDYQEPLTCAIIHMFTHTHTHTHTGGFDMKVLRRRSPFWLTLTTWDNTGYVWFIAGSCLMEGGRAGRR